MDTSTARELDGSELRSFGLSTGAIIAVLFGMLIPWIWDLRYPVWPWAILAILGLLALVKPKSLRLVYRLWMRVGLLISKFTTPIILGFVFFLVFVPVGFVFRFFSRDPLNRRFDASLGTYRIECVDLSLGTLENPY